MKGTSPFGFTCLGLFFLFLVLPALTLAAYAAVAWMFMIGWGAVIPHTSLGTVLPTLSFRDALFLAWLFLL